MIRALCQAKRLDMTDWFDWTAPLAQNWIVAETDRVVGCIMVNYGVPIGRMEFLVVPPGLPRLVRANVVQSLCHAAFEQLHRHGSQAVASLVDEQDVVWQRAAERRGAVKIGSGNFYMKRL